MCDLSLVRKGWEDRAQMGQEPFYVIHVYAIIFLKLVFVHPLSVNVWQVLWHASEVFPVEMAEVQLLWLHVPTCTSV